jgi:hypothetical protein
MNTLPPNSSFGWPWGVTSRLLSPFPSGVQSCLKGSILPKQPGAGEIAAKLHNWLIDKTPKTPQTVLYTMLVFGLTAILGSGCQGNEPPTFQA